MYRELERSNSTGEKCELRSGTHRIKMRAKVIKLKVENTLCILYSLDYTFPDNDGDGKYSARMGFGIYTCLTHRLTVHNLVSPWCNIET